MVSLFVYHDIINPLPGEQKGEHFSQILGIWLFAWTSQGLNLGPPDYESFLW